MNLDDLPDLLTPREAAALLRLDPRTVSQYGAKGKIPAIRLPGGHRRFRREVIVALLQDEVVEPAPEPHRKFNCPKFGPACQRCSREAGEPVAWDACTASASTTFGIGFSGRLGGSGSS